MAIRNHKHSLKWIADGYEFGYYCAFLKPCLTEKTVYAEAILFVES